MTSCERTALMRRDYKLPVETTVKIIDSTGDAGLAKALEDFKENFIQAGIAIVPENSDAAVTFLFEYKQKKDPLLPSRVSIVKKEKNYLVFTAESRSSMHHLIYSYLYRHWGDTWYLPAKEGHIRHTKVIDPFFRTRIRWEYEVPFLVATQEWGESSDWHRRMRSVVDRNIVVLHNWHRMIPPKKYFDQHPEYFAFRDGERKPRQLCTTNPEVIQTYISAVKDHLKKNPGITVFSLSPEDGYGFCQCPACRMLDKQPGSITDRLIVFFNAVVAGVQQEYPYAKGAFYAYLNYTEPPVSVKPHHGIIPVVCHTPWEFCHNCSITDHTCSDNKRFKSILEKWVHLSPEVYIREYYGHFLWFGNWPILHTVEKDVAYYKKIGVKGIISESHEHWGTAGWVHYGAGMYLAGDTEPWNAIVKRYCTGLFPSSAPLISQFINILESRAEEVGCRRMDVMFNKSFLTKLESVIQKAQKTARTEEEKQLVSIYREGVSVTRHLTDIACARSRGDIEQMVWLTKEFLQWIDENQAEKKIVPVIKYSLAKAVTAQYSLARFESEKQQFIQLFADEFGITLDSIPHSMPVQKWLVSPVYDNTIKQTPIIPMYPLFLISKLVTGIDTEYEPERMNVRLKRVVFDDDFFSLYECFPFRPTGIRYYKKRFNLKEPFTGIIAIRAIDGYRLSLNGDTIGKTVKRRFEKKYLFDYYPVELLAGTHQMVVKIETSDKLSKDDFTVMLYDHTGMPVKID